MMFIMLEYRDISMSLNIFLESLYKFFFERPIVRSESEENT